MDVGSFFLQCLHEDQVHDFHHGCVLTGLRHGVEVHLIFFGFGDFDVARCGTHCFLHDFRHALGAFIVTGNEFRDAALRGDHRHDIKSRAVPEFIECQHVERVRHGNKQLSAKTCYRSDFVVLGKIGRDKGKNLFRHTELREIYRRRIQASPRGDHHVLLGDKLLIHEDL